MELADNGNINFIELTKNYIEHELNLFNKLETISKLIPEFNYVDICSNNKPIEIKLKNVLYYFEIVNLDEMSVENILDTVAQMKKNKLPKLPKLNFDNGDIQGNNILYVGKSKGNFQSRLNQHLGEATEKIYALHLNKWPVAITKKMKLRLYYISLEELLKNEDDTLLEMLEIAMHYKLKPILGRVSH